MKYCNRQRIKYLDFAYNLKYQFKEVGTTPFDLLLFICENCNEYGKIKTSYKNIIDHTHIDSTKTIKKYLEELERDQIINYKKEFAYKTINGKTFRDQAIFNIKLDLVQVKIYQYKQIEDYLEEKLQDAQELDKIIEEECRKLIFRYDIQTLLNHQFLRKPKTNYLNNKIYNKNIARSS